MAQKLEIYKCVSCGNIVEVLEGGSGQLVCCGSPMEKLAAKSTDEGTEKHLPVIEKVDGGIKVKVGSIAHPMEPEHYIQWIQLIADGRAYRQFLNPGDAPEAFFNIEAESVSAREHCSIHGLWEVQ